MRTLGTLLTAIIVSMCLTSCGGGAAETSAPAVTIPSPPLNPYAVAGDGQATVTFAAPASNGGSAIARYTVKSHPAGGVDANGGTASLSHVITGLTNNVSYTFTVTATNAAGTSAESMSSNAATPMAPRVLTIPGAPLNPSASPGNQQATVSFQPPASNGGSPITGYTVVSNPPGGIDSNAGTPGSSHVVTGLMNGASYAFTVSATNAAGVGAASIASNSVIPTAPMVPVTASWRAGAGLQTMRVMHTATLLQNGKVLVVGGALSATGLTSLASAELYDPATKKWSAAGNLSETRRLHTATLLSNGKVLVAGGLGDAAAGSIAGISVTRSSADLYDPATNTWVRMASLTTGRYSHTATLLRNGRVLVAGGVGGDETGAELYDPAANTWTPAGKLATGRHLHTATLLSNGNVLIAGGSNGLDTNPLASAELYDAASNAWSAAGKLATARSEHTATLLANGKVLVAGGFPGDVTIPPIASSELFDPATKAWTAAGSLATGRRSHTATLLADGTVLAAGGSFTRLSGSIDFYFKYSYASAERFNPLTNTWSSAPPLAVARAMHTATLLANGTVLAAGGYDHIGGSACCDSGFASTEIYQQVPSP